MSESDSLINESQRRKDRQGKYLAMNSWKRDQQNNNRQERLDDHLALSPTDFTRSIRLLLLVAVDKRAGSCALSSMCRWPTLGVRGVGGFRSSGIRRNDGHAESTPKVSPRVRVGSGCRRAGRSGFAFVALDIMITLCA